MRNPLIGGLLLLPIVFLLQPLPIDETRYLAVAWEMHRTGNFLVPHLNGAWYADKPPLLFWLINLGWLFTGVHAWSARLMPFLCAGLGVLMLGRLTLRLGGSAATARAAMWLLLGSAYFAIFANAIMFDVLLTSCVLLALHGVLDLEAGALRRGVLVTGVAIGLCILAKGPVMLLDFGFAALTAFWWSDRLGTRRWRYVAGLALAVGLGIVLALLWAVPAALHGGDDYARAIFLHQTLDRVSDSFAHQRPIWLYFVALPLMLLPWPLVVRMRWRDLRGLGRERAVRFALAWVLPTFVVFCLISGKQPHYLLPLLPGIALLLATMLQRGVLRLRTGLFALALVVLGVALAVAPWFVAGHRGWDLLIEMWPLWGVLVALCAVPLWWLRHRCGAAVPALAMLALVLLCKLAVIQGPGYRYDMRPISAALKAAEDRGQPVVHLGWHHGVYEFAGRLVQPLPTITLGELHDWAKVHPDGLVMSFDRRFRFAAKPVFSQPFRSGMAGMWRVRDALASGIDPVDAHAKDDGDILPSSGD
ncbi:MAG TPA: glycosyltransferase family 39 protein [Rhodanobacteraceae bacterium]|nr:glycosyltransferase family 39 protein [Rhodanobacteraceae bacterium]